MEILILGIVTALGAFVVCKRWLRSRTIRRLSGTLDITASAIMALIFFGTASGMAIAMIGGLFFSGLLTAHNKLTEAMEDKR